MKTFDCTIYVELALADDAEHEDAQVMLERLTDVLMNVDVAVTSAWPDNVEEREEGT